MKTLTALLYMHASKLGWLLLCLLLYSTGKELRAQTPLLWGAVKNNDFKQVEIALKNEADVNASDENKATILMWAAYKCDLQTVKYLVSKGADYTKKGTIKFGGGGYYGNLISIATHREDLDMLRYFIEELKIDVNDREYNEQDNRDTGWSALEWAISGFTGDETLIKYLSGKGANFEYVKEINLKGKKLSKLPNFVFKCVNLEKLDCSINTITSLSDSLRNLKKIKILHCFLNQLVSLPESLGELKNLSYLDCSNNQLTYLPQGLGNLKYLTRLDCSWNNLKILPENLEKLTNLTELVCWRNQITSMPIQLLEKKDLKIRCGFVNLDVIYIPEFRMAEGFSIDTMLEDDMKTGLSKKNGESLYLCYRKYYIKKTEGKVSFNVMRVLTYGAWWYSRNGQFAKAQATAQELSEMLEKYKEDNQEKMQHLEQSDKDKLLYIEIQAQAILQYTAQGINLLSAKEQAEIATQTAEERKKLAESLHQEALDAKENALKDRKEAEANAQKAQKLTAEAHEAKERAKAEAQKSRRLTVWVTLISMGVLLIVLLFLVYFVYTKRKITHKAQELEKRNQEIHALAEELRQQSDALIEQRNELEAITEELKQQNEVVESKNVALEQLQDTKDLMISAVNHDLRNPLNPIINFSGADYPDMTEAERLASIHAHAGMMLKLIDNIMQVYRADKITVQPAPHSLHRATEEAIAVMLVAQNRKPKIINDIPQDLQASFDYAYIERVLENLLSNAIKYTASEEKGGVVRFFAEIVASPTSARGELVKISIQDNGKGIPREQYESIFLPFVNPDAKSIGSAKSVGIGLTFCKTIVEAHNSRIELASEVGKGTTFSFALPYLKPETKTNETTAQNLTATPLLEAEREAVAEYIAEIKRLGWRDGSLTTYLETMQVPDLPALQAWKNNLLEARKQRKKDIFEQLLN